MFFYTDHGTSPKIGWSYMDGSAHGVLITTELTWPNGLAVDYAGIINTHQSFIAILVECSIITLTFIALRKYLVIDQLKVGSCPNDDNFVQICFCPFLYSI